MHGISIDGMLVLKCGSYINSFKAHELHERGSRRNLGGHIGRTIVKKMSSGSDVAIVFMKLLKIWLS